MNNKDTSVQDAETEFDSESRFIEVVDGSQALPTVRPEDIDAIAEQNDYVKQLESTGVDYGLVINEAFVRGMRDIGYKSSATAIDEILDNSIEAGAKHITVLFGYGPKSDKKPTSLAVIDNGHGMTPAMIRAAVLWGGGNRAERRMFGRYGYGLPSACVSLGRKFTVYSRMLGNPWYMVPIDLDQIADGTFHREEGRLAAPPARQVSLPPWISKHIQATLGELKHGTIIVIEKLDHIVPKTTDALERDFKQHFGVQYRNYIRNVNIFVNDEKVEALDPLFLDPTARYYDENELRAEALKPACIEVKDTETKKVIGVVNVRYSYLPPGFQNVDGAMGSRLLNSRFNIMKENNGILVLRAGRQIDIVSSKCPWHTFQVYDRNWKVEIDFSPSLDEEFSITTSKQQVVLSQRMWETLDKAGVRRTITELVTRYDVERRRKTHQEDEPGQGKQRSAEKAMAEARKFKTANPKPSPEQEAERKKRKRQEIDKRTKETGKAREIVERELEADIKASPYKVLFESLPESPFYRVDNIDTQVVVFINRAHQFYTNVYMGTDSTPRLRAALELLLLVMAESELNATNERKEFYKNERPLWSSQFGTTLRILDQYNPQIDEESAALGRDEVIVTSADAEAS